MNKNVLFAILLVMVFLTSSCNGININNSFETEATPTETTVRPTPPEGMSSDLFSNQVAINGHIFTLPCLVSDFSAAGFAPKEWSYGDGYYLQAGYEVKYPIYAENEDWFYMYIYNTSDKKLLDADCLVGMINFESRYLEQEEVFIPNGLTFGASIEEVKAIYGEPQSERETNKDRILLHYFETEDEDTNAVFFTFGANGLEEISIKTEAYDIFSKT
jgi:hypothetical protein